MKLNFNATSNKLNDFLRFPGVLYFDENNLSSNSKKLINFDFIKEDIAMAKEMKSRLEEYRSDIEKFFQGESFQVVNLIEYIYDDLSLIEYSEKDVLFNKLKSLSHEDLIRPIILKLLITVDYYKDEELDIKAIENKIENIMANDKNLFKFIKDSDLDADFKWTFMIFVDNPHEYIENYIELMNKLYPIYLEYYSQYEDIMNEEGLRLKNFIEENGSKGISELSNSILSENIFKDSDEVNIFTSFISPSSIMLSDSIKLHSEYKVNTLIWGINSSQIFELLKKEQEDKLLNRIDIFKSLGDETRYEILRMISKGVAPNKEIAKRLGVSGATVSYHINSFVDNGVLNIKRINNKLTHVIDYDLLNNLIEEFRKDFNF